MTISSTVRKVGPYTGNGTTTTFPFSFKVFSADDILAIKLNVSTDIETTLVLNHDYTILLNADQSSNPGGSITLLTLNSELIQVPMPLPSGYTLVISSTLRNLQPTDITNQGGFYPQVLEDALDRACIQIQQLEEKVARSIKISMFDDVSAMSILIDNIATLAANLSSINSFSKVYIGASMTDPVLRNDGTALQNGDLYFNTVVGEMRVYAAELIDYEKVADGIASALGRVSPHYALMNESFNGRKLGDVVNNGVLDLLDAIAAAKYAATVDPEYSAYKTYMEGAFASIVLADTSKYSVYMKTMTTGWLDTALVSINTELSGI
jgi:hypothetical protein